MTKAKIKAEKLRIQAEHCLDGAVLDVGFAANPNTYLQDAVGIDIKLPAVIPPNYRKTALCNLNKEDIPYGDSTFLNVVAGDVIEHLESPSRFLREANRVLMDEGRLIICTPHANDWWTTLHNWFFRGIVNDPDPGEHLQNWTIMDMTRLLKKNGFRVDTIEGYYMRFPKIALHIRVRRFPILSWDVFYVCTKVSKPDERVLVMVDDEMDHV